MLRNLHVKNLALIEEADVNFGAGLNILSGETGAGKSIIIGSINLALGEKVPKSMLRDGAENALVELVFSVPPEQEAALEALDVFCEDGEVILSRRIRSGGRSVCRINSETVSAAAMRKVASLLIDIHGQHEHQSLLTKKNHMKYLDAYAKKELGDRLQTLSECYRVYSDCKKELEEASLDAGQRAREISFLQFEIDEIDAAGLQPGEDEALEEEYRRLSHAQKIMESAAACRELLSDGAINAADQVGNGVRTLLSVADYDGRIAGLAEQLGEIDSLLGDFNRELSGYLDEFEFSDGRFAEIENRLNEINRLKTKYGQNIARILEYRGEKETELEKLLNYEEYRNGLEETLKKAEADLQKNCEEVSEIRKTRARALTAEVKDALLSLNFLDVQFEMEFQRLDAYTANGWDEARFLISTNPGEPLKPLDAVASGGELSRIMLALKTALAENDEIETLIFDEIDSGISGRTAQMVAEKIELIAANHQVICITHLPQIAAMADHHFLIEKTANDVSTISSIRLLDREESIAELARMLGGVKITDTVMQNAREMKDLADTVRTYSV